MLWRALFNALAASPRMKSMASRYGAGRGVGRQFAAGATLADAIAVARQCIAAGRAPTLAYLGSPAPTMAEADAATRTAIRIIRELADAGVDRQLSIRPTHFGLQIDRATCVDNLRRILDAATARHVFVRLEMEDARYTQITLDVFETLWQQNYHTAGVVLQARLHRSLEDARRLIALGARICLVKGAYAEPGRIAHRSKAHINAAFRALMELLLADGTHPAIATHDRTLIEATTSFARARAIGPDRFEFELFYRAAPDLETALLTQGYRVRVYVPFGGEWFPYVMERLGQRPADIGLVLRGLLGREAS